MKSNYEILLINLRKFILKYYINRVFKGILLGFTIIISFFLIVNLIEFLAWSNTLIRQILFYSFLLTSASILVYYIAIPLLKMMNLGKTLSKEEAARIIGKHFDEVSDKLLNTLQLNSYVTDDNYALIEAGIEQKSRQLIAVPFKKAINLKKNSKYLKYFLPPLLLLLFLMGYSPTTITNPTQRIINFDREYERPLPYELHILNKELSTLQKNDFTLEVEARGSIIPEYISINDGQFSYRMGETGKGFYQYTFNTVNQDVYFTLNTPDFTSKSYRIKVFPRPIIFGFEAHLHFPKYLKKQDEMVENSGDMIVPEGTQIVWQIFTRDASQIAVRLADTLIYLDKLNSNTFYFEQTTEESSTYSLSANNEFVNSVDSLVFNVRVIKDDFPKIEVKEYADNGDYGLRNFFGEISDDYGFNGLQFKYRKDSIPMPDWQEIKLDIQKEITNQSFDYLFLAQEAGFKPGDNISYYFEVRDNDALHGYKKTRTSVFYMQLPDAEELQKISDDQSEDLKKKLSESMTEIEKLTKQIEETTMSLFEKKDLNWIDKKKLTELLEKELDIKNQLREIQEINREIEEIESLIDKKTDPELEQKLNQLKELFDELLKSDLENELKKLEEQLKNMDKKKMEDLLKEMKKNSEELKENLEQNLELYKQYEVEKKMEEALNKLMELAEKQLNLSEKTTKKELDKDQSLENQKEIEKSFSEIQEQFKEIDSLDQQLEEPFNVKSDTLAEKSIQEEMQKAEENLEKSKEKKAGEHQKQAGEKMKELGEQMKMNFEGAKAEQMGEDAEQVRTLLDNLIDMSFKQEDLMDRMKNTSTNDPLFIDNIEVLKLLQTNFIVVNDSLIALSKRQIFIQPFIIDESGKITSNMERALKSIEERRVGEALGFQQYAMTSTNNLSLMLAESLKKMKAAMQMAGQKSGKGSCQNPGAGGKPSLEDIMNAQKKLGERMKKNGKKEGETGGGGVNGNSQELARMAAMQGEIRRQMQELIDQLEADGQGDNGLNKVAEEMQKTEEDLIRRQFRQETLERQREIETRLLMSKKALQEREKEKERESTEGKNSKNRNLNEKLKYKADEMGQEEILITMPIEVSPYYLNLYKKYLFKLENEKNENQRK